MINTSLRILDRCNLVFPISIPKHKNGRDLNEQEILDLIPLIFLVVIIIAIFRGFIRGKSKDTLEVIDLGKPIDLGEVWKEE